MILNRRPCTIGASINSRTQKHGDRDVPAFDIPISFMLESQELNAFMGDTVTHTAWFNERKDGAHEPLHPDVKYYPIDREYENSSVTIYLGLKEQIFSLEVCTITKFKMVPCVGGLTQVKCTLQIPVDETNSSLTEWLSKDGDCEVTFGDKAEAKKDANQPELALNSFGEAPVAAVKKRGRKPRNAAGDSLN